MPTSAFLSSKGAGKKPWSQVPKTKRGKPLNGKEFLYGEGTSPAHKQPKENWYRVWVDEVEKPREEVAKGEDENTLLFDPTRCVRESWTSFRPGWSHLSPRGHAWVKGNPLPSALTSVACVAPAVSQTNFPSGLTVPTPFKAETLLRQIYQGSANLPEEQGT